MENGFKSQFDNDIPLSDMIESLRNELLKSIESSDDANLKFNVESIELELQVLIQRETEAKGDIKFWVINASAAKKRADQYIHTFRLKLQPEHSSGRVVKVGDQTNGKPK